MKGKGDYPFGSSGKLGVHSDLLNFFLCAFEGPIGQDAHDALLEARLSDRGPERRQGVHETGGGVDQRVVVVFRGQPHMGRDLEEALTLALNGGRPLDADQPANVEVLPPEKNDATKSAEQG